MDASRTLLFVTFALFAGTAFAHDCSGGPDGGMDATGNQCSQSDAVVAGAAAPAAKTWAAITTPARSLARASAPQRHSKAPSSVPEPSPIVKVKRSVEGS